MGKKRTINDQKFNKKVQGKKLVRTIEDKIEKRLIKKKIM
jgi:hypothetical protein